VAPVLIESVAVPSEIDWSTAGIPALTATPALADKPLSVTVTTAAPALSASTVPLLLTETIEPAVLQAPSVIGAVVASL